jgi:signal transduction histidine kinase
MSTWEEGALMADRRSIASGMSTPRLWDRLRAIAAEERRTLAFVAAVVLLYVVFRQVFPLGFADISATAADVLDAVWKDFCLHYALAIAMLLVIEPVRRVGPRGGARRLFAVSGAVVVAAAVAATGWGSLLAWAGEQDVGEIFGVWHMFFLRFAILAAMLVAVGEFHRREILSLEAMRAAEADRAALEQETLQARLKTLEAQIEPHFLFNTLANVRRLYDTDAVAGEAMLERLMRYLEIALPSMRGDRVTLDREARLLEAYLELQQVRMGKRLAYAIDIAPALRHSEVPPMMLLTLVENAIKHGLAPQREGGRVDVRARLDGSQLRLEVADTGRGLGGDTSGGGTGLANIRARLAAMFGPAADLTLAPREPRGLLATIRMPA